MKYKVTINESVYEVELTNNEASLNEAPRANTSDANAKTLKAPLAGTILNVSANAGDIVKAGQVLLILEAMKMENEIVAPSDCKVIKVLAAKGGAVNTGDPLMILE